LDNLTSSGSLLTSRGELPTLKVQFGTTSEGVTLAGNCHSVRLADIDNDGDLDMVIAQLGRPGDAGVTPFGYANNVLFNMTNAANFNNRTGPVAPPPAGPVVNQVNPPEAAQGQVIKVNVVGAYFAGIPTVNFGDGVTVLETSPSSPDGHTVSVKLNIAPDAAIGPRLVTVTNPDGQSAYGEANLFHVSDTTIISNTAVHADWNLYQ
jgi:hypothetical protein